MNPDDVKSILENALEGCDVQVQGDGRHFDLVIVGDQFEGMRTIKRQQTVYAALNEQIASGAIHAVNMRVFTPGELDAAKKD